MLQLQGVFAEDPLRLRPGDEFPGRFTVAMSSPGQQTYSLKEVVITVKNAGISLETVEQELGVKFSEKTESLQVPLEKLLSLLGVPGQTRREQIYKINHEMINNLLPGKTVRTETELVGGKESLLVEKHIEREDDESLVMLMVVTYVPESDLIFTFSFMDNLGDRSEMNVLRQQVLNSVKFWKTSELPAA